MKFAGSFDQNQFVVEIGRIELRQEILGRGVKLLFEIEKVGIVRNNRPDTDEPFDTFMQDNVGHFAVEACGR